MEQSRLGWYTQHIVHLVASEFTVDILTTWKSRLTAIFKEGSRLIS